MSDTKAPLQILELVRDFGIACLTGKPTNDLFNRIEAALKLLPVTSQTQSTTVINPLNHEQTK